MYLQVQWYTYTLHITGCRFALFCACLNKDYIGFKVVVHCLRTL